MFGQDPRTAKPAPVKLASRGLVIVHLNSLGGEFLSGSRAKECKKYSKKAGVGAGR